MAEYSFVIRLLLRRARPLFRQNRIEVCITPFTFLHGVFQEQSFAAHTQLFHHAIRSAILRVAGGPDAVQFQLVESNVKNGASAFGHVAVTPIFAIENVAEVGGAIRFVVDFSIRSPARRLGAATASALRGRERETPASLRAYLVPKSSGVLLRDRTHTHGRRFRRPRGLRAAAAVRSRAETSDPFRHHSEWRG